MRNNEYRLDSKVRFSEVDHTRKITIPSIINYFQDCSIMQSEELGYGLSYLRKHKKAWILTGWHILIDRYPEAGEKITTGTWATSFKGFLGERNFCMRDENGDIVARANSLWLYMDWEKGRPCKPSDEEIEKYGKGAPLEMPPFSRRIEIPADMKEADRFPVRKYHIDINEHVNNCQYVQMALEVCDEKSKIRSIRVEYKKSAVYKDVMIAKAAEEKERTVVSLDAEDGSTYAVVELKTVQ